VLRRILREKKGRERIWAAVALWRVERQIVGDLIVADPRQKGLDALIELLDDPDPGVQIEVTQALQKLGPHAERAVPALVRSLRKSDPGWRALAANTLASLGPGARKAERALQQALKDEDSLVRLEVAVALGSINPRHPLVVPALLEIGEKCPEHVDGVVTALGELKIHARAAVPWLIQMLRHEDDAVCASAGRTLAQIDPEAARKAEIP
jgi:HEAT repeat protein